MTSCTAHVELKTKRGNSLRKCHEKAEPNPGGGSRNAVKIAMIRGTDEPSRSHCTAACTPHPVLTRGEKLAWRVCKSPGIHSILVEALKSLRSLWTVPATKVRSN